MHNFEKWEKESAFVVLVVLAVFVELFSGLTGSFSPSPSGLDGSFSPSPSGLTGSFSPSGLTGSSPSVLEGSPSFISPSPFWVFFSFSEKGCWSPFVDSSPVRCLKKVDYLS